MGIQNEIAFTKVELGQYELELEWALGGQKGQGASRQLR